MSYILFAWLTSITYSVGAVVGKIATKHHISNPWLYNVVFFVISVVCIIPFAIVGHVSLPQDWVSMGWLSVANAVSGALFMLAFYEVDLSILSPLSSLRTPIAALVGAVIFRESLTLMQQILIGIIFFAGLFVQMEERFSLKALWKKPTFLALTWIVASVWFNSMIKEASLHNGFWEVSLWSNVGGMLLTFLTFPLFIRDLKKTPTSRYYGIALSTVLFTAGLLFSVKAFGQNVGISMAIISLPLAMIMTMALSVFAPKLLEKHTWRVYVIRFVAAMVMFAAALGLSK